MAKGKHTPSRPPTGKRRTGEGESTASPAPESAWSNFRTILVALLVALGIRVALIEPFEIEGPSMEPTLLNGDRVVLAKYAYGLFLPFTKKAILTWNEPNPGDVVIVKSPHDELDIVKRVIGVPGDIIEVRSGAVYKNGRGILDKKLGPCGEQDGEHFEEGCVWHQEKVGDHVYRTSQMGALRFPDSPQGMAHAPLGDSFPAVEVPEGHVYVMGDHRDRSNDSRYFGMVPMGRVKGKAVFIHWSRDPSFRGVFVNSRWTRIFSFID